MDLVMPILPRPIDKAVRPLLEELPLDRSMSALLVTEPIDGEAASVVQRIVADPTIARRPALVAGLWLYVDDLDASHKVSQSIDDTTGSFWHGIMHRREGDFGNSHYWFRRAGRHPAMDLIEGYDPRAFIDRVEKARHGKMDVEDLIDMQRCEWSALFQWCAQR
jgi:hypothetical protein